MTKIVHVAKIKGVAGAEGHLLRLLPELKQVGFDVHMVMLHPRDNHVQEFVEPLRAANVPVKKIAIGNHLTSPLVLSGLWKYFRAQKPDLVHTHMIHGDIYGTLAARAASVPTVVSSRHALDPFREKFPIGWINRLMWKFIDKGIAISDAVKQHSMEIGAVSPEKMQTIHYGIELPEFKKEQLINLRQQWNLHKDTPVVGSLCRLIEEKGLTYAIDAFAKVQEHIPNAHYFIAGDGKLRQPLEQQGQQLGISDHVHFLGWQEDAHAFLASIDVLLGPSVREGFGLVFLEAMAHSLPIVSTTTSAMPEIIIDGETGFLAPPADADALVEPLVQLLEDRELAKKMGQAGHQRLETHFSVEKMVNQTAELYQELLEKK